MKIKLSFLSLFSLLGVTIIYAQEQSTEKQYKWSIAAAVNSTDAQIGDPEKASWGYAKSNFTNFGDITNKSTSFSIIPKYSIHKNTLLRLEFGITNIHLINYYDGNAHLASNNPTSHSTSNQNIEQKIYRYTSGIQWSFVSRKFLESHFGITASYLQYSDMKYTNRFESRDLPSNKLTGGFEDKAIATGGFASGIGALVGGNIYLQKYISIGAEFSSSLLYYKIGDTFSGISTELINPSSSTTQIYSYSTTSFKGLQFSKPLSSFNISVWF